MCEIWDVHREFWVHDRKASLSFLSSFKIPMAVYEKTEWDPLQIILMLVFVTLTIFIKTSL